MDEPSTSEHTPLMRPPITPTYVFNSAAIRQRRNRVRNFQCCICSVMILIFTIALVITISYRIDHPDDFSNDTTSDNIDSNISLTTLLALTWPRADLIMKPWDDIVFEKDLKDADEAGKKALDYRDNFEKSSCTLQPGSPAFRAQLALGTTPPSTQLARSGYAKDHASKHFFKRRQCMTRTCLSGPSINATWSLPMCTQKPNISCPPSKYRTINGTCNSLEYPQDWGVSFIPFRRVLPPDYGDGISSPRKAHDSSELPSARQVSLQIHRPLYVADPKFTVVLAVWGQFLDHDITATALSKGANGTSISCCNAFITPGLIPHPECFPVKLEKGDSNFDKYNISCMEFVRSAPAPYCSLGPREQFNQATAYIDGSTVYGPYDALALSLRNFTNGELKMLITSNGKELLPVSHDPNDGCNEAKLNKEGKYCFVSGDIRANENLHLTSMHLIWARQHNRIARKLHKINPHWTDEILFQESRRIIAAQMQHITYNEFLPIIMGPEVMDKLELWPKSRGYYHGYNSSVDPNIANSFAASAFRFAHTLLPTLMKVASSLSQTPEYVHLHKMLFNPYSLYTDGGLDKAMRGALQTDMQKVDPFFTPELTSHLFERDTPMKSVTGRAPISPCGLDLVSLNIQRGRDHGLPSYPAWREHCGFKRPTSFDDLKDVMDSASLHRISTIYKSIDDVDLYTASLSEIPLEGSVLGSTVTCLLLDQFVRLKRGDRYWYETPEKPQAFTEKQLDEIRKTTLGGIICQNGDSLEAAQRFVMRSIDDGNPLINCYSHPEADMRHWYDKPLTKVKMSSAKGSSVAVITGKI